MNFTTTLVMCAFLLAAWFDTRFELLRPATTGWRVVHIGVSCALLQVAAIGGKFLVPEHGDLGREFVVVFAILLPVFVYTFVSALWILRTLAEVTFARR